MDHAQRDLTDVGRQAGKIGLGAHDLEGAPGDLLGIAEVVVEGGGHARLLPLRTTTAIPPIVMLGLDPSIQGKRPVARTWTFGSRPRVTRSGGGRVVATQGHGDKPRDDGAVRLLSITPTSSSC